MLAACYGSLRNSINGTILECKPFTGRNRKGTGSSINGTILECKPTNTGDTKKSVTVLMEPYWNVNRTMGRLVQSLPPY